MTHDFCVWSPVAVARRRVVGLALAPALLLLAPGVAPSQTRPPVVAVLMTLAYPARLQAFRAGLASAGYEEGKTLTVLLRSGGDDRLDALAAELVGLKPDVLVGDSAPTTRALRRASGTIPIVFMATADPVGAGFVTSLARPGGTVTGLTEMTAELAGKRLQLLREIRPALRTVAVLGNPDHAFHASMIRDADQAAQRLGIRLAHYSVRDQAGIEGAFAAMGPAKAEAVLNLPHPLFGRERALLATLALRHRLPSSVTAIEFVQAGGLLSYSPDYTEQARRAATYVDKILKGAKPADLPVEQPTKFVLVINRKTAKALGLTIPPSLLQRADQLID